MIQERGRRWVPSGRSDTSINLCAMIVSNESPVIGNFTIMYARFHPVLSIMAVWNPVIVVDRHAFGHSMSSSGHDVNMRLCSPRGSHVTRHQRDV
jgi:hypothetical protein